jgi:amino acid adenylation domain-containing protein
MCSRGRIHIAPAESRGAEVFKEGSRVATSVLAPAAPDCNIAWILWHGATRAGAREAIVERGAATTYRALCDRAVAIGRTLTALGVGPDDRVAIFLERGVDAAASFFGASAVGAIAVIVNETLHPRQIEHILRHAQARCLITSADLLARQPRAIEADAAVVTTDAIPASAALTPRPRVGPDVAQIIYTSGSTGQPKGVTLSHANLWAGMRAVTSYVGITREDRIASLLPFSFDYGFNQLLCAVGSGAALVVERSPVPQRVVMALRSAGVTVLAAVPPLWLQLLTAESLRTEPLPSLRAMTNSGGRLPTHAVRTLCRAQPQAQLFLMYGLTEAFRSTYLDPDESADHPESIGRAIPGAEILVLRDDLTPCDVDEVGELVHRGPTVALGYWNDPEATARVFRPNPLRPNGTPDAERVVFSGDLVRRDAEGRLYYVARRDRLIKTLGYRVSPDEVLEALYASGQIVEGVVTSEPDALRGERIVAHVVFAEGGSLDALEAFCAAELPRYMQPSRFVGREAIPRTTSGKHDTRMVWES